MTIIAVICGLKSEADVVRNTVGGESIRVEISGADAQRAYQLSRAACANGAAAVVSVGVSGGLDPALAPGDLVIGEAVVVEEGSRFEADAELLSQLTSAHPGKSRDLAQHTEKSDGDPGFSVGAPSRAGRRDERIRVTSGVLYGSDAIIDSVAAKSELFASSAAVAVDMESHGAARAAAEAGVPFIAVRAIADPADRALPLAALGAVAPDGSTRVLKTLWEAAKAPGQFPALMQLGSDSNKALARLRRDLPAIFAQLEKALAP